MKNRWILVGAFVGLVALGGGVLLGQQTAPPVQTPPVQTPAVPGGKVGEKTLPPRPDQNAITPRTPSTPTRGGIPTLPLPGTLPGNVSPPTPSGVGSSAVPDQRRLPSNVPRSTVPGLPGGVSGLPGGSFPEAPMPSYPGSFGGRSPMGQPGVFSRPSPAAFADPIYGPYVPQAAPIGTVPGFGTVQPSTPTAAFEKPFSDYTPPPVYSPYMNLYRFNPRGPIDNYYSLVRPFVMQDAVNQQYSRRLQDVQMNNRLQQTIIQRLQQQNQIQQGTYQPGYYMNHGSFFQGY